MAIDIKARLAKRKALGSERLQLNRALSASINKAKIKPKVAPVLKAIPGRVSAKLFYRETPSKHKNDSTLFRSYFLGTIPIGFMHIYDTKDVKPYVFYINLRQSKAFWTEDKAHAWIIRKLGELPEDE